jgi:hypothetical protein
LYLSIEVSLRKIVLIWTLFFLICFGLGYPTLNRYDPGKVPGTADAEVYASMVSGALKADNYYRVFVPWVAKPFFWLANGRLGTWNPALFGMLVATSILTASTAIVTLLMGLRCGYSYVTSLVAAMLFLLNFVVPNWNLAGYVDSGEGLFLAMVAWSMLSERWFLLPVWAVPGTFSKETFAPFAVVFVVIWWLTDRPLRATRLFWILALAILACGATLLSLAHLGGFFSGAVNFTSEMSQFSKVGFMRALLMCLAAREFWYIFVWLFPLGLIRIRRMDQRWIYAAAGTFVVALFFGAYDDAQGNTARALFNVVGPLLSLAAADLLTGSKSQHAWNLRGEDLLARSQGSEEAW